MPVRDGARHLLAHRSTWDELVLAAENPPAHPRETQKRQHDDHDQDHSDDDSSRGHAHTVRLKAVCVERVDGAILAHMAGYAIAKLDEIEVLDDGRCPMRPVRQHFGITAFGVNTWTAREAGDRIINEHDEADEDEELYLVHAGHAMFEIDGERVDAPAGSFVFVRPGVKRTAFAQEPGTTIVALGATPGKAYEPSGWELWSPLRPLYEAGKYAEVADRARELAEANPQYVELFYNLACCESMAGRASEAIEHLRHAVEMSDRVRMYAEKDSDFDPIRNEPAFKELIG
jgi:mannose-6-phosphate isomerase-like protein (cupin superfamily)